MPASQSKQQKAIQEQFAGNKEYQAALDAAAAQKKQDEINTGSTVSNSVAGPLPPGGTPLPPGGTPLPNVNVLPPVIPPLGTKIADIIQAKFDEVNTVKPVPPPTAIQQEIVHVQDGAITPPVTKLVNVIPTSYATTIQQGQAVKQAKDTRDTNIRKFITDPYSVGDSLTFDEKVRIARENNVNYDTYRDLNVNYIAVGNPANPEYISKREYDNLIQWAKDNKMNVEDFERGIKQKGLNWANVYLANFGESRSDAARRDVEKWETEVLSKLPKDMQTAYKKAQETGNYDQFNALSTKYGKEYDVYLKSVDKELVSDSKLMAIYQERGREAAITAYQNQQTAMAKHAEDINKNFEKWINSEAPVELQRAYKDYGIAGYEGAVKAYNERIDKEMAELNAGGYVDKDGNIDVYRYLGDAGDIDRGMESSVAYQRLTDRLANDNKEVGQYEFNRLWEEEVKKVKSEYELDSIDQRAALLADIGVAKESIKEAKYYAELSGEKKIWQGTTPWDEYKGEKATAGGVLKMGAEIVVPFYYTATHWNELSAGAKVLGILLDAATIALPAIAITKAGGAAARTVGTASRAERLFAAIKAGGGLAVKEALGPLNIVVHPIASAKLTKNAIRNFAGFLLKPNRMEEAVLTTSTGQIILQAKNFKGSIKAAEKAGELLAERMAKGEQLFVEFVDKETGTAWRVEVKPSLLQKETKSISHATTDVTPFEKRLEVEYQVGKPIKEQGVFVAADPVTEYVPQSASGKGAIPIAAESSGKAEKVWYYKPEDIARMDADPIKELTFSHANNIPADISKDIENIVKKYNGRVSGSLNTYIKVPGSPRPNDIDIVFSSRDVANKAREEIIELIEKNGYSTHRGKDIRSIEINKGSIKTIEPKIEKVTTRPDKNGLFPGDKVGDTVVFKGKLDKDGLDGMIQEAKTDNLLVESKPLRDGNFDVKVVRKNVVLKTTKTYEHPVIGGKVRRRVMAVVEDDKGRILLGTDRMEPKGYFDLPGGEMFDPLNPSSGGEYYSIMDSAEEQVRSETNIDFRKGQVEQLDPYMGRTNRHALQGTYLFKAKAGNSTIDRTWWNRDILDRVSKGEVVPDEILKEAKSKPEMQEAIWWDGKTSIGVSPAAFDILTTLKKQGKLNVDLSKLRISEKTPVELITARDNGIYKPESLLVGGIDVKKINKTIKPKGKYQEILNFDTIEHHDSMIPKEYIQKPTKINGFDVETLGEQYIRQSYGSVFGSKIKKRVQSVDKMAPIIKKKLEQDGMAVLRKPGIVVWSEKSKELVEPVDKLFYYKNPKDLGWVKELEARFGVGKKTAPTIKQLTFRTGPRQFVAQINMDKPISLETWAKLKTSGFIEDLKAPWQPAITVREVKGAVAAQTGVKVATPKISGVLSLDDVKTLTRELLRGKHITGRQASNIIRASALVGATGLRTEKLFAEKLESKEEKRVREEREKAERDLRKTKRVNISELRVINAREVPATTERPVRVIPKRGGRIPARPTERITERTSVLRTVERNPSRIPNRTARTVERIPSERPPERTIRTPERTPSRRVLPRERPFSRTLPRIPLPERPILRFPRGKTQSDREKRNIIAEAGGAIAWRQGMVRGKDRWDTIVNPYQSNEQYLMVLGNPPRGATIVEHGKGSAYATAQMLRGQPPKHSLDVDSGFQDINISAEGRRINLRFKPDPKGLTTGDITIGKRHNSISEPPKSISTPIKPIDGRKARITPPSKGISSKPRRLE